MTLNKSTPFGQRFSLIILKRCFGQHFGQKKLFKVPRQPPISRRLLSYEPPCTSYRNPTYTVGIGSQPSLPGRTWRTADALLVNEPWHTRRLRAREQHGRRCAYTRPPLGISSRYYARYDPLMGRRNRCKA